MIIAYVPALVALVAAVLYCVSANGNVRELARVSFACGMLVTLYTLAAHVVRIG